MAKIRLLLSSCLVAIFLIPAPSTSASPPDLVAQTNAKLVLCGGGSVPDDVLAQFIKTAGDAEAHIVILSAATASPSKKVLGDAADKVASIDLLHTNDAKKANEPAFIEPLQKATGVWLQEGDPQAFLATYQGTKVEKELRKLLNRGGVIGASSSVASLAGKFWIDGTPGKLKIGNGFAWIPDAIVDVHFLKRNRLDRLQEALKMQPGTLGIGLDETTALVLRSRNGRVLGKSYVSFALPVSPRRPLSVQTASAGAEVDLIALRKRRWHEPTRSFPRISPPPQKSPKGRSLSAVAAACRTKGGKNSSSLPAAQTP